MRRKRLGVVVDGSFNTGLTVRLDPSVSTEEMRIGDFVIIEGAENRYFSTIADMQLRATDPRIAADPPRTLSPFIAQALAGTSTYGIVQVQPRLMMKKPDPAVIPEGLPEEQVQPVRTIPMHFAELYQADALDFATVFGKEGGKHFAMGTPLTMDIPICIDLERLVERSDGIFGQSGTGKSFLARILLCGVIQSGVAVNLIFDMHDEYAFGRESEDGVFVRGLRQLFGSPRVLVYSLDERASGLAGRSVDVILRLGLNQIEAEDVLLLAEELNLRGTAEATIGLLQDLYGLRCPAPWPRCNVSSDWWGGVPTSCQRRASRRLTRWWPRWTRDSTSSSNSGATTVSSTTLWWPTWSPVGCANSTRRRQSGTSKLRPQPISPSP